MSKKATFRFYEQLNDFIAFNKRKTPFSYCFTGTPSLKDAIEALGVPHTEVELVLVNSQSVSFNYLLQEADYISVYPRFTQLDISTISQVQPRPLPEIKFILDVHLGQLVKYLRMLGIDTAYQRLNSDPHLIQQAVNEQRILITRDKGILKHKAITYGYWLRATQPKEQLLETIDQFDLLPKLTPFSRCLLCNSQLIQVNKKSIASKLPSNTQKYFNHFRYCINCGKIYWEGSHFTHMNQLIQQLIFSSKLV